MAKAQASTGEILAALNALNGRFDRLEVEVFRQGIDIGDVKHDVSAIKPKVDHIYSILDSHMKTHGRNLARKRHARGRAARSYANLDFPDCRWYGR